MSTSIKESCLVKTTSNQSNSLQSLSTSLRSQEDSCSSRGSVRFHQVEIREYYVTIGDNPSCSSGCPISLDWQYDDDLKEVPVDLYEQHREGQRRAMHEMKMPSTVRHDTLRDWNVPTREIFMAQRTCDEIKKQRSETFRQTQRRESIKAVARRLKKVVQVRKIGLTQ